MRWRYTVLDEDEPMPCKVCNGGGQIVCEACNSEGATLLQLMAACSQCDGTGYKKCSQCDGTGEDGLPW
jgi:hypothetical protein